MRRQDEKPEVGDLWQVYDPQDGVFFDVYVIKRVKQRWQVLDLEHLSLVTVPSVAWFWARIA